MPSLLAIDGTIYQGNTLVLLLLAGALAPLVLMRLIARELAWALFGVMINLVLAALVVRLRPFASSTLQLTVVFATEAALMWSLFVIVTGRRGAAEYCGESAAPSHLACLLGMSRVAALSAGAASAVMLAYRVTVRGVYFALELFHGAPLAQNQTLEFQEEGLMMIAALIVACLGGLWATGERRLITALLWLFVLGVLWLALLRPLYHQFDNGTYGRTSGVLVAIVGLSLVVTGFVAVQSIFRGRARWRAVRRNPDALLGEYGDWPGLRKSTGVIGILLVLLICFQTAVPPNVGPIGDTLSALITAVCAGATGGAVFSLLGRRWSVNLADTGMGLVTLAAASLAVAFVPSEPVALEARFPVVFNAYMFALAIMSWFWVWVGRVWRQQIDNGRAWTAGGRLAPLSERFAFFVACLALVLGSLMAIWPRLRPIATLDDSLGRVAAAVAAHLLLVLVLLWNGRMVQRSSFSALTVLVILSLVGFIAVRSWPLTSTIVDAGGRSALQYVGTGAW